jgi:SWI/SNF-related matrix-associated actin-dependent regulator 1 of chromatin subfamily A
MKDSEYGELMQFDENKLKQLQDDKENRINILTQIEILKQLAVQGILLQAISWIEDFLETGEKLIVFATHKFVIDSLMETFPNISVKIDGSVPTNKRQQIVDKFQKDKKIKLFIGNIKAAGIGITLTAASSVAFLELPWTPGELVQAIDRTHRIGQKKLVNVYFLIAANTVLQKIAKLLDKKRKVLNSILDGGISDNKSLFAELIENI